ncbi:MAG: hypothetical protein HRT69_04855 [Flavobacteriaceae bacterium]|jgi:hypothetical protein|nr:hypothetical protein [Flavobacteriaceae bacterium]
MKVIFIKEHPSGIERGTIIPNAKPQTIERWMNEGYIESYEEMQFEVEKQGASLEIGGGASKKKLKKQSKSGKRRGKK